MPYFLSQTFGTGADAESNFIQPYVNLYGVNWHCAADLNGLSRMIVKCPTNQGIENDSRILPISRSMLADYAPDDGETNDWEAPDLATKLIKRALLKQILKGDDFGFNSGILDLTLSHIPAQRRQNIRNKLLRYGFDLSSLTLSDSVADAMRAIFPQLKIRLDSGAQSPSGTFTDDFSGEGVNIDLASHTPSGGTAWTRVDGSADMAQVHTDGILYNNTTDASGALYQCDDQGSADQYIQYVAKGTGIAAFTCNRASSRTAYIGIRFSSSDIQVFKNNAGFTLLGQTTDNLVVADDVIRLESSGDSHEAFVNASSKIGPVTDSFNNTQTRQGVNARSTGTNILWMDDFEAGVLGGGGGGDNQIIKLIGPGGYFAGNGGFLAGNGGRHVG